MEPTIAQVLAAIIPRQRDPLPNPDCCPTCREAYDAVINRADWRHLNDAKREAAALRPQEGTR